MFFFLPLVLATHSLALDEYRAKEDGNKLMLTTPYGEKSFSSESRLDGMREYKIVIPLSELKPAGEEEEPPTLPPMPALQAAAPVPAVAPNVTVQNLTGIDPPVKDENKEKKEPEREVASVDGYNFDDTDRLVVEANRLYNRGRYHEAMTYIDEVNRKRPKYVRGWVMKGSLLFVLGHKDLAKDAWEQALRLDPGSTYIKDLMTRYH